MSDPVIDKTMATRIATQLGWEPKREWQGLTDEERTYLAWESNNGPHCVAMTEAMLKQKNA